MSRKNVDGAFTNMEKCFQSLKNIVNSEISQLEAQSDLKPIIKLQDIYMKNCSVKECNTGHYSSSKVIHLYVPKECVSYLNKVTDLGLPTGDVSHGYYSFSYNSDTSKENFTKILNAIETLDTATNEVNVAAASQNQKTRDTILTMLSDIGVPKKYYGFTSSRARNKSWINCAWATEIFNAFPVRTDSISDCRKRLEESFNKLYDADQKKRKEEEQKRQNEIIRKETERELAFMIAKYDLSITSDWVDLLFSIIGRNKYLSLAHYLRKNRGDWNDGYHYAKLGLEKFSVESAQDQDIFECINNIITTYDDIDGRYFRDCDWSYDVLFGLAKDENPSLCEDYEKVCEKTDEY